MSQIYGVESSIDTAQPLMWGTQLSTIMRGLLTLTQLPKKNSIGHTITH